MTRKVCLGKGQAKLAACMVALACAMALGLPGLALAQGYSVDLSGHEYTLGPGGEMTGQIRVANMQDEPVTVKLWLSDLVRMPDNTESYANDDTLSKEPRSLSKWLQLPQPEVTIAAHESSMVPYYIKLPADSTLGGSYWVSVMVTKSTTQEEIEQQLKPEEGKMQIGIRTVLRFNVRVIVTIPGTAHPAGKFAAAEIKREEHEAKDGGKISSMIAKATFTNEDIAFVRPVAYLDIRDTTGKSVYKSEPMERTLLSESSLDFNFDISDLVLDPGEYMALIIANYGAPKLAGAQIKLNYTDTDRTNAQAVAELRKQMEEEKARLKAESEAKAAAASE
jgi:hypothetical protein